MALLWLTCLTACTVGADGSQSLLLDGGFRRGFEVWAPAPGKHVRSALLAGPDPGPPVWGLAQWSSRFPLDGEPTRLPDGARRWTNPGKTVTLGPGGDDPDLTLAVDAAREYDGRARRAGQPWVHLLAETKFDCAKSLAEVTAVDFRLEARVPRCERADVPGYTPNLHAAQLQWFITVQNLNRASKGYGDYYWFGLALFDDRRRVTPLSVHGDQGTGRLIYCPPNTTYATASLHDHDWVTFRGDLRPQLLAGLETAWARGFLKDSRDLADYRLGGTNLGWEVPGPFVCEAQVRGAEVVVRWVP